MLPADLSARGHMSQTPRTSVLTAGAATRTLRASFHQLQEAAMDTRIPRPLPAPTR